MTEAESSHSLLVLTDLRFDFGRQILRGAIGYTQEHPPWTVSIRMQHDEPAWAVALPQAVLFTAESLDLAGEFARRGVRTVACGGGIVDVPLRVSHDDSAVGRLAAEHFIDHGHRRFAYLAPWAGHVAVERASGFLARVREHGFREAYTSPHLMPLLRDAGSLPDLLPFQLHHDRTLASSPIGILAFNDRHGATLVQQFKTQGFSQPDEVAVLGVDNDDLFCETVSPSLSSVDTASYHVGYAAAALAADTRRRRESITIPPRSVIARESTDLFAVEDRALREALRFLHVNFARQIDWRQLALSVGTNRRSLERRFREVLRRSPGKELQRLRMEHATHLLRSTNMAVHEVSTACGYTTPARFHVVFRRVLGMTPGEYRRAAHERLELAATDLATPEHADDNLGPGHTPKVPELGLTVGDLRGRA